MDTQEALNLTRRFKALLDGKISYRSVLLFGSFARGTADNDSDIDIAIIVDDDTGDFFATRPLLWKLRRQLDEHIEPHLLSLSNDESGFAAEVIKYGIAV